MRTSKAEEEEQGFIVTTTGRFGYSKNYAYTLKTLTVQSTHFFFYKHQVYKHNQPEILVFLNTLLNTSQPQIFEIFLKDFLNLAFSKQKLV